MIKKKISKHWFRTLFDRGPISEMLNKRLLGHKVWYTYLILSVSSEFFNFISRHELDWAFICQNGNVDHNQTFLKLVGFLSYINKNSTFGNERCKQFCIVSNKCSA